MSTSPPVPDRAYQYSFLMMGGQSLGVAQLATIATGAFTLTKGYMKVDTESAAASDDLDTINGGVEGMHLMLRPVSGARTIVLKHNTGNIICDGAVDLPLADTTDFALLFYANSKWTVVAYSTLVAAGADVTTNGVQTLSNKTLTAPVIADFTNAAHDHGDADDGGNIPASSVTGTAVVQARQVISGNGLTGGGDLSADRTLAVGAGTGLLANADDVEIRETFLRQTSTVLTNAQVLALRATPITVAAAPGAGKFNEFRSAVLIFNRTAGYTETADNLAIKYVDGSGTAASATIETTGFVDAAGDAITFAPPAATPPIITAAGELSNAPLVLHNTGDGEYGGGDAANTITVVVTYRIHSTGL